ncbi:MULTISPECIES: hypothetical protein [unclassified Bacillus (in: firmicutes)]|uniref:hypothetical protein n=1 Tax=unclassified Bacillus (in: firmicutes) TaxID=185979 RepID=UPI0008E00C12|nr:MULTISPECIES: hypothetical protein [unclassified Bacillus (in: firmicutes)]SFJ33218.1 hypothetical protein SAMN04488574_11081 [Bacillus sp. 71mf]SFT01629.1 hypothetical protein SAMN04488145_10755 [Bacillus sp. 103mf]
MKKTCSFLMIVWVCIFVSACSSQTKSETEMKSDSGKNSTTSQPNVKVKPYKEPLTQVGDKAQHPLGMFVLNQLSEPNTTIELGPLNIKVERIKIVRSTELSDIGKYNLEERGLNTEEMNAIQLTTTLENTSDQPLDLGKGPIKTLVLSNGEQVDVYKMSADPKERSLKAREKMKFTLICFLSQVPGDLKDVKVTTDVVRDKTTNNEVSALKTVEIKM